MRRLLIHTMAIGLLAGTFASPGAGAATATASKPTTTTILRGVFTDSATYSGSGSASVTRRSGVRTLRLARNFQADPGAVRLRMYLATTPSGDRFIDLGPMTKNGAQSFRVPAGISLSTYRYAISWCAAVNEPITQAKLIRARR